MVYWSLSRRTERYFSVSAGGVLTQNLVMRLTSLWKADVSLLWVWVPWLEQNKSESCNERNKDIV